MHEATHCGIFGAVVPALSELLANLFDALWSLLLFRGKMIVSMTGKTYQLLGYLKFCKKSGDFSEAETWVIIILLLLTD